MNVTDGFIIFLIILLLIYSGYRLIVAKKTVMLLSICAQLFAVTMAVLCFIYNVAALQYIQVCFIFLGIITPFIFLLLDYFKMIKKVKKQGIYKGLIEPALPGPLAARRTDLAHNAINPIESDIRADDIIGEIDTDLGELKTGLKSCLCLAASFIERKEYENASNIYGTLSALFKKIPGILFNHANACYCRGNYTEALKNYKKAAVISTEYRNIIFYNIGNAYFMLKRYDSAVKYYERAVGQGNEPAGTLENIALACLCKGDLKAALDFFNKALEKYGENYKTHYMLGGLLEEMGRSEEAVKEFEKCTSLEPHCMEGHEELVGLLVKQGRLHEAINVYDIITGLRPCDYKWYYNKGNIYYKLDNKAEAVACYKKAVELNSAEYRSLYNLAVALDDLGNDAEAIETFMKVIELKPDFTAAYGNLGIALSNAGRFDEALNIYKKGLSEYPAESSLHLNMGFTLWQAGRNLKAAASFRKVLEINPEEKEASYYLGAVLVESRRYNEAVEAYKTALKTTPSDSELYYNIAAVYSILGRYETAKDNLEKAIELNNSLRENAKKDSAFDGMRKSEDFFKLVS